MQTPEDRPEEPAASWIEVLGRRARERPERRAFVFLEDGEREAAALTFGQLETRARALGAALQAAVAPGARALLMLPPGLAFVEAFLGCLYAGVVAVPAYPPASPRGLPRLRALAADAGPALLLDHRPPARQGAAALAGPDTLCLAVDEVADELAADWRDPGAGPDTLAFLQYTSGSTADPKGVMVTHGNLLAQRGGDPPRLRPVGGVGDRELAAALPRHGADRRRAPAALSGARAAC